MRHGQLETGPARSLGQVVVVEEAQPELLIEPADGFVDRPLHEQAEPGELTRREPLSPMLLAPSPRKRVHLFQVRIRHVLHQLRRRGIVRHRPDHANSHPLSVPSAISPFRVFRVFRG